MHPSFPFQLKSPTEDSPPWLTLNTIWYFETCKKKLSKIFLDSCQLLIYPSVSSWDTSCSPRKTQVLRCGWNVLPHLQGILYGEKAKCVGTAPAYEGQESKSESPEKAGQPGKACFWTPFP
ncbi:uncharacterized protein LOC144234484 [Crocuta crocuta]